LDERSSGRCLDDQRSVLPALIGARFVQASESKNQAEAEYRYVLTRLRDNGESIALIRGEEEERAGVDRSFAKVLTAWRDIAVQTMRTTVVSQASGFIAPVLPIILCAPKFLDGSMSLGQVMQAASAFTIVQGAFNWLVDNYPRMADWTASGCTRGGRERRQSQPHHDRKRERWSGAASSGSVGAARRRDGRHRRDGCCN
jgi:ABC-type uncharacterized transport system fused permease/ATPase subunit